jgi:hypothetical protein
MEATKLSFYCIAKNIIFGRANLVRISFGYTNPSPSCSCCLFVGQAWVGFPIFPKGWHAPIRGLALPSPPSQSQAHEKQEECASLQTTEEAVNNTFNDAPYLDLRSVHEGQAYDMFKNRVFAQARDFDPTLMEKAGIDFKFTAIWYALSWENFVLVARTTKFNTQFTKVMETKNLQKSSLASKVVNPFTRARAPPLQGDEGTSTFRKYPQN